MLYQIVSFRMSIDELIYFALLTPIPRNPSFQTYFIQPRAEHLTSMSSYYIRLPLSFLINLVRDIPTVPTTFPPPSYLRNAGRVMSSHIRTKKCLFFGKFYVSTDPQCIMYYDFLWFKKVCHYLSKAHVIIFFVTRKSQKIRKSMKIDEKS